MYDVLVCSACVAKIDTLRRYAGTPGVLMVARDTPQDGWKLIGRPEDQSQHVDIGANFRPVDNATTGDKRPPSPSAEDTQQAKRLRTAIDEARTSPLLSSRPQPCLAPEPNPKAQDILSAARSEAPRGFVELLGAGDIFLTHGWRDRWCRCSSSVSCTFSSSLNC